MQRADLAGFASDLIICLISVVFFLLLSKWSKIAAVIFILFWSLFHYSNYEHVAVNSDLVSLEYADHLLSPTFLFGSGFAFSNVFLLLIILAFSFTVFKVKAVQLNFTSIFSILIITLGAVITRNGFTSVLQQQYRVYNARWRSINVVHANVEDIFSAGLHNMEFFVDPMHKAKYQSSLQSDLNGNPVVPLGNQGHNVLLIVLESISGGILPSVRAHHGVESDLTMPALDEISRQHILYTNFISHQRQTNRGIFSLLCGDYPKLNSTTPKMTEYINHFKMDCLPRLLQKNGYATTYIQASPLPYMLKNLFMQKAGFQEVFGTEWFKESYSKNFWGVDDRAFFEHSFNLFKQKSEADKPWFITMLNVGTHHPLNVPEDYRIIPEEQPKQRALNYLDESLYSFINKLKSRGYLKNTLVVITTDESQGINIGKKKNSKERLLQQWGLLAIMHPGAGRMKIHDKFAQIDIAVSVADYLGLPVDNLSFGGRSIFRKYEEDRCIYFGNTYVRVTGFFSTDGMLNVCKENFSRCEQYRLPDNRIFSPGKILNRKLTQEEIKDLASFVRVSNGSVVDMEESNGATFQFASAEEHIVPPGPQKYLMAGQFFIIPKNAAVSVVLKGRVVKGDKSKIFLKHDLASVSGRIRINKFMYKTLKEGDVFSTAYDFYNYETFYSTEFRITAELLEGDTAAIVLDEASLEYEFRPPTREEHAAATRRYDKKVGRDLGARIKIENKSG
jgi:phosphoglycerol transferase MdoB-like AlkP superfamily enzyme